ncbi:hypothetical protein [Propionicimonas paludicola]|nr:hypothetical protein [Propionicimonas paludicola]
MLQPLVLIGVAIDGASFLLSLVAYARLPLFLVQTIIAASVAVVVVLAVPFLNVRLRWSDAAAVLCVLAGLIGLALLGTDQPAVAPPPGFLAATASSLVALIVVLTVWYRRGPAWLFGTISALAYAGVAIAARGTDDAGGLLQMLCQPLAIVIVGFGVVAFTAYIRALEVGPVALAASLVAVIEVVVPAVIGVALFGDTLAPGLVLPAAASVVIALGGCIALGFSPATRAASG